MDTPTLMKSGWNFVYFVKSIDASLNIISIKVHCLCKTFLCKAPDISVQCDVKSVNLVGTSLFAELLQSLARYQLCQLPIINNDAGVQYQFTVLVGRKCDISLQEPEPEVE